MGKVLVWDISFRLANVGGPSGYLYNIHKFLSVHPCEQIVFLSDLLTSQSDNVSETHSNSIRQRIVAELKRSRIFFRLNDLIYTLWKEYHVCNVNLPKSIHLDDYDFLHFHQANDVRRYSALYKNTHCKSILTTHCPCPRTEEVLAAKPWYYRMFANWIRRQERLCYEQADYLLFPCKEAREPYEKDINIRALFHRMEHKFIYCPTGIMDLSISKSSMQKLSSLGIPEGAFVISYFGRHNTIKGYDVLKKVGEALLPKCQNLYFLCAGKGDIAPLQHPRWIELGFVNNTPELLQQSDLYILPNRETYFDLIVLEVLRAGIPIIMAENGGNRYFKSLPLPEREGMKFFDVNRVDVLCELVECCISQKQSHQDEYKKNGLANRLLWQKYFTMSTYVRNYLARINQLNSSLTI